MSALASLIDNYLAGVNTLRQAVAGMTSEQLRARPIPGKWSTLEVICHLADFDPILADRMKRIIAEDRPQLLGASENRFAAALAYQERDAQEELAIIAQTRAQMARILRQQKDDVLGRVGVHNERGELTLERLLTMATNHIPHHVKFIEDKRQARCFAQTSSTGRDGADSPASVRPSSSRSSSRWARILSRSRVWPVSQRRRASQRPTWTNFRRVCTSSDDNGSEWETAASRGVPTANSSTSGLISRASTGREGEEVLRMERTSQR